MGVANLYIIWFKKLNSQIVNILIKQQMQNCMLIISTISESHLYHKIKKYHKSPSINQRNNEREF